MGSHPLQVTFPKSAVNQGILTALCQEFWTLTGSPGSDYILQTSTNLFDWLSLLTNNASFDGQLRFELPVPADPYRFFRALAP